MLDPGRLFTGVHFCILKSLVGCDTLRNILRDHLVDAVFVFPGNVANSVIGQCKCGRFYCGCHSEENLCADCWQKQEAARIARLGELIHQDYLETASNITRKPGISIVVAVGLVVTGSVLLTMGGAERDWGVGLLVVATPFTIFAVGKYLIAKKEVAAAEEIKTRHP